MSAYVSQGISAAYVIQDALERGKSADREKLREAIAATDITEGPALFPGYQRIKFDAARITTAMVGPNDCCPPIASTGIVSFDFARNARLSIAS